MLMRTNYETLESIHSVDHNDDTTDKFGSKWERTLWEAYSYRCPTADCDTKRSGPCKRTENSKT